LRDAAIVELQRAISLAALAASFTTFLQAEDNANDFQWRACQENTPAYQQVVARSAPLIPLRSVRVPANSLVKLAREEAKPPADLHPGSTKSD
jgi:hypothetical protein